MEPETRYPVIGAIVLLLALGAAFAFTWWARDGAADAPYYVVVFDRQSVEGLQVGSDVSMRGVKVGRVERFTLGSENINRVKVLVRVDRQTPVSENSSAVVARNFLTGLARINLVTPGEPGPQLTHVPPGEDYPVIPEGTSGMDQIAESANRLALSGEEALANLNRLMTPENREAFGQTLAATRDIAVGLSERLDGLDRTLAGVDASVRAFGETNRSIAAAAQQANVLMRDAGTTLGEARTTLSEGTVAIRDARGSLAEFTRLARTLEREAGEFGARASGAADTGLLELRATAQETRRAAELLSQALERLSEPRSALIGPGARELGPGERLP
ncbi:MlaD family protein [Quisquiliibacterium transsilvanicum]|uniref:Phospholipid/cholesterol/gamma-HCH transport system substrate-binding protein n=1 Tax=Quisquiliibacterium transsilvanicum TaxID=1549638 RepID=A0A7W8MAE2_9BURK|nr:MlaD family protein [Quisquiliibacterium transsilvanicum]MBB5273567.1 phospholipid/cholesterol/gamma-HCH transport system substrate-binding protein [Quisquiliibacterium transsilvanicum]